jgi:hypothetical protein
MEGMKTAVIRDFGYNDWQTDGMGTLVCPHGRRCEDDQRDGLAGCGCISPLVQEGLI